MSTNQYLETIPYMDIIFGSSPEQGGISCTDALMSNIPYIIYTANSTSSPAEYFLKSINKGHWVARSGENFVKEVSNQLKRISQGISESTKEECQLLSLKLNLVKVLMNTLKDFLIGLH